MDGQTEITKLVQAELLGTVSDMLKAIACMNDRVAPRISEIVDLVDELLVDIDAHAQETGEIPPRTPATILTLV